MSAARAGRPGGVGHVGTPKTFALGQDATTLQPEIASLPGRYRSKVMHEGENEYI